MKRILIVDDEPLIRYALSEALRRVGCGVTAVANGKDANNEIHRSFYDICFLDVRLPDANGLDLMTGLREISPATRIIIMTAVDLTKRQVDELRAKGCHYLSKPFDLKEAHSLVSRSAMRKKSAACDV